MPPYFHLHDEVHGIYTIGVPFTNSLFVLKRNVLTNYIIAYCRKMDISFEMSSTYTHHIKVILCGHGLIKFK